MRPLQRTRFERHAKECAAGSSRGCLHLVDFLGEFNRLLARIRTFHTAVHVALLAFAISDANDLENYVAVDFLVHR